MSVMATKPKTTAKGYCVVYATIVTRNDPPATAYCTAPNPSKGLTKKTRTFSTKRMSRPFAFSAPTPRSRIRPERIFGSERRGAAMNGAGAYNATPLGLFRVLKAVGSRQSAVGSRQKAEGRRQKAEGQKAEEGK